jgi:hypothetical protein
VSLHLKNPKTGANRRKRTKESENAKFAGFIRVTLKDPPLLGFPKLRQRLPASQPILPKVAKFLNVFGPVACQKDG